MRLIDSLFKGKHWFAFIGLEVVSLCMLFSYNGYQKSVYFTTANDVVGRAYSVISSVTSFINLQTENRQLEADNQRLYREIDALKRQLEDVKVDSLHRLRQLPSRYDVVNAQVVNSTIHKKYNLMTINKGEADGIKPEMGVVCSHGVVGIVYMTSQHYSIVMPLLNENSKISCRVRATDYFGTMTWKRGTSRLAYVTGIPRHSKVKKRNIIETNGFSDIFPPGLPIGVVARVSDAPDGMSYLLTLQPFTDFASLREVSVITNYTAAERKQLEQQADSVAESQN